MRVTCEGHKKVPSTPERITLDRVHRSSSRVARLKEQVYDYNFAELSSLIRFLVEESQVVEVSVLKFLQSRPV